MSRAPTRVRTSSGPAAGEQPLSRRTLLWVGLAGLTTRLLYMTQHAASSLFGFPVLDELYYETTARLLANGESVVGINPGFRPLLYPWLLARLYAWSGDGGSIAVVLLQHLLGVATGLLLTYVALRLTGSQPTALVAGLLYAFAGPPLFFEGQLLNTTLITFLTVVLLVAFSRLDLEPVGRDRAAPLGAWAVTGLILGVAAQARPNVLLVALAFPASLVLLERPWPRRLLPPTVATVALLLTLALFGALQKPYFGHFQLVTGSGGINFYLGNKRGADGMIPRQDRAVSYGAEYRDSVQVFAFEEYLASRPDASPSPARISRHWLGRGLQEILADPAAWTLLMLRKCWLLLWSYEIPNHTSFDFVAAEEATILRWLPTRWWLLVCLAPIGAWWVYRHGNRSLLFWLSSFVLLWALGLVLFFVNSRYRIPLWPAGCILAAAGVTAFYEALRSRHGPRLAAMSLVVAGGLLLSTLGPPGVERSNWSRDHFYRSLARLERGELEEAATDARRSFDLEPEEAVYVYQIGAVELARDRFPEAIEAFREAARLKPREPRIYNDLGIALEATGREREAYDHYLRAVDLVPDYAPALTNAALLELRAGWLEEAERHLLAAERAGDTSAAYLCARGLWYRARGEEGLSRRFLEQAADLEPDLVERLIRESEKPLRLPSPEGP